MYWALHILAIALEVCGTTCMKLSDGFSKLTPSILVFIFYILSFVAFIYVLKRIDLSFAYAVWAVLGILSVSVVGVVWFEETASILKLASIGLIIIGVIGLSLSGAGH